ncbi:MAG: hypothetical protein J6T80_07230 [Paludibacteraceae bacterium]|nr:hypothetical protein [Paludibacteraceae bacterium]
MARVELIKGIASISGTITKRPNGDRLVARTYHGETRLYLFSKDAGVRKTPVTEREKAQRSQFAAIASEVARLRREGDKRAKKIIWCEVKSRLASEQKSTTAR